MPCVEQQQALLAELLLQRRLLRLVQLHGAVVAVRQEGQAVGAENLPFVLEVGQQDFAGLCLPALHGALDFGRLEQRRIGMHGDLEFAAAGLVHVIGELHQVFTVEIGGRVGRGKVPLGLGGCCRANTQDGSHQGEFEFHESSRTMDVDKYG